MITTPNRLRRLVVASLGVALATSGIAVVDAGAASASDGGMFASVNASRSANGHSPYTWNSDLASVAQAQAQRMASKKTLYHNPNLATDVTNYRWVGENVGYGPSSDVIENAFMHSPLHRANILDSDFTQIGIGSVRDSGGRLWVAQVFREPTGGGGSTTTAARTTTHRSNHHASSGHATRPTQQRPWHPGTRTVTHSSNASAPAPTASTAPGPAARTHRRTDPRPNPVPTLAQRVSYAEAQSNPSGGDPLADTLAFAVTMSAVGS